MEEITNETTVKPKEMAIILGLTVRRINQLIQDGVLVSAKRGQIYLAKSIQGYVNHLLPDKYTASDRQSDAAKRKAEAVIKASKATIAQLEAQELQGKMHRSEDVQAMTEDLIYSIRGMLLAVPGRVATDTANATTPTETANIIRKELYNVLKELSRYHYDPKKYEARVRDRQDWSVRDEADEDGEE